LDKESKLPPDSVALPLYSFFRASLALTVRRTLKFKLVYLTNDVRRVRQLPRAVAVWQQDLGNPRRTVFYD